MKRDPFELEKELMEEWMEEPLRERLAGLIADEIEAGGNPLSLKDDVWNGIGIWASIFLDSTPGWTCSEDNIRILQEVLLPDVIERTNEIVRERNK
jgi:hypothetical protein